jgi:hypothetical protein
MEIIILTCLEAQLITSRIQERDLSEFLNTELVLEIRASSPKECVIK